MKITPYTTKNAGLISGGIYRRKKSCTTSTEARSTVKTVFIFISTFVLQTSPPFSFSGREGRLHAFSFT
jgi:hypothetical protein